MFLYLFIANCTSPEVIRGANKNRNTHILECLVGKTNPEESARSRAEVWNSAHSRSIENHSQIESLKKRVLKLEKELLSSSVKSSFIPERGANLFEKTQQTTIYDLFADALSREGSVNRKEGEPKIEDLGEVEQ